MTRLEGTPVRPETATASSAPSRTPVPREFRAALAALASAQKSSSGAPAYSRFVNRRLGR